MLQTDQDDAEAQVWTINEGGGASGPQPQESILSKKTLTTQENQVLALGLKYAIVPACVPIDDIIAPKPQLGN